MVGEIRPEHESEWAAMGPVAELLGVGTAETVRKWVRQAEIDAGAPAGDDVGGVRRAQTAQAGERRAETGQRDPEGGLGFLRGRTRPATAVIVRFIDEHKDRRVVRFAMGCRVDLRRAHRARLKIAPSTYYEHRRAPARRPWVRDEQLKPQISRVHAANYGVYGARKVWLQLNREGHPGRSVHRRTADGRAGSGRCRRGARSSAPRSRIRPRNEPADLAGGTSGRWHRTGCGLPTSPMSRPGRAGCYVAFVIDAYARRILGWRAATTMTDAAVLDAIEQAIWTRHERARDLTGLVPSRPRHPIHVDRVHRTARRSRDRRLGRLRRRRV